MPYRKRKSRESDSGKPVEKESGKQNKLLDPKSAANISPQKKKKTLEPSPAAAADEKMAQHGHHQTRKHNHHRGRGGGGFNSVSLYRTSSIDPDTGIPIKATDMSFLKQPQHHLITPAEAQQNAKRGISMSGENLHPMNVAAALQKKDGAGNRNNNSVSPGLSADALRKLETSGSGRGGGSGAAAHHGSNGASAGGGGEVASDLKVKLADQWLEEAEAETFTPSRTLDNMDNNTISTNTKQRLDSNGSTASVSNHNNMSPPPVPVPAQASSKRRGSAGKALTLTNSRLGKIHEEKDGQEQQNKKKEKQGVAGDNGTNTSEIGDSDVALFDTSVVAKGEDDAANMFGIYNCHYDSSSKREFPAQDILYHIGLDKSMDLHNMFGDVEYVIMGGSCNRMQRFAYLAAKELEIPIPVGCSFSDICTTDRYSMYKVGPVLSVSHGMGIPSISILLHEVAKLLYHARCRKDVLWFRTGSSGGIGCEPGTVVLTTEAVNGAFDPFHEVLILGKKIKRPTQLDRDLAEDILNTHVGGEVSSVVSFYPGGHGTSRRGSNTPSVASNAFHRPSAVSEQSGRPRLASVGSLSAPLLGPSGANGNSDGNYPVVLGRTMCANDFYEGQGRLDGALCDYTKEEKMQYLERAKECGVLNIEMESLVFASFCNRSKVRGAVLCVTLLNRLNGDQVESTSEQLKEYTERPQKLTLKYIKKLMRSTK
eukprot:Nk52_evm24s266 gene=Nk52_evmTU24s266